VGHVVTGKDYFNRDVEIAKLTGLLLNGAHVLLIGQRRIGKSSLMLETVNRLRERAICLYVDVQHCDSPKEIIVKLGYVTQEHRSLLKTTGDAFFGIFKYIRESVDELGSTELFKIKLREKAEVDWADIGN
jgi:AAA+ ATPase superfamily predicted ATPase